MKKLLLSVVLCLSFLFVSNVNADFTLYEIKGGKGVMFMNDGVQNADFIQFYEITDRNNVKEWKIIINTPGGNAFATIGIVNRIKELKARGVKFITESYSWASSAGGYIFMMGDERIIHEGAVIMWHTIEAQVQHSNNAYRVPEYQWRMIRLLDRYIRKCFKQQTNMSEKSIAHWLDGDVQQWMSAETAYNVGIATKLIKH